MILMNDTNTCLAGMGGLATGDTYPISATQGQSLAIATFGACHLATPHIHPRASEFFAVIDGTGLEVGFLLDDLFVDANGTAIETRATLGKRQGILFPQGAVHWQFNPTCNNLTAMASFDSSDPGFQFLSSSLFDLTEEVTAGALAWPKDIDGESLHKYKEKIPLAMIELADNCLQKCGLTR
jgi:oxalate decarboxylase/phosphoglucose isomerase-like protein (cupin superfamily)